MEIKKKLIYKQEIVKAKNVTFAWRKLTAYLKDMGLTYDKSYGGKGVKIKPYTYKIYYKSKERVDT